MTLNFWWMCIANLLLFASAYILFPVLSFVMLEQVGISLPQMGTIFLAFAAAIFAVGSFHALPCDEYKRGNALPYSTLIMLMVAAGYVFADSYTRLSLLASMQRVCFGLATTVSITVTIDITALTRHSAGNMIYVWSVGLDMLMEAGASVLLFDFYDFRMVVYLAVAVGTFSMFLASRVYAVSRAPTDMRLHDMDRFLLPCVWVPALNILLIAFAPGVLLPLSHIGNYIALLTLVILVCLAMPFMKMFAELSHHCQRDTASMMCYLTMETELLAGFVTVCRLVDAYLLYHAVGIATILVIFLFALLTYPYYKKKRVR